MEHSFQFFENRDCRYFPCHDGLSALNCLFCYCPLYARVPCPGNPQFIRKDDGRMIKKCTACTFPHEPENYERIMRLLKSPAPAAGAAVSGADSPNGDNPNGGCHGGECRDRGADFLDFSVNVHPLGMPPAVQRALAGLMDSCVRYPDRQCTALKQALSRHCSVPENMVCAGNGASEIITLAVDALSPRTALLVSPTFSGYERALAARHAAVSFCPLLREEDFCFTGRFAQAFFQQLEKRPDIVFLCQPNNPTGTCIPPDMLQDIAQRCERQGTFLVVDECFLGFVRGGAALSARRLLASYTHVLVVDAATKLYAMPGLRLGWALCGNRALLRRMEQLQSEWSVSGPAQLAGIAALQEDGWLEKTQHLVEGGRQFLSAGLSECGCTVYPGTANFLLFTALRRLDEGLLRRNICIRSSAGFHGLGDLDYRIAVLRESENRRLVTAVREVLDESE